jgi:hypothetical protein
MPKSLREKTSDSSFRYYASSRVEILIGFTLTIVIFVLMVLPVVALYELSDVGSLRGYWDSDRFYGCFQNGNVHLNNC